MGGSSSSGDTTTTIRFAPYIESKHSDALDMSVSTRESIIDVSPYAAYAAVSSDNAFFGIGYSISSFPSLYDTFGKFMAGLDIDELFTSSFSYKMDSALSNDYIDSEISIMDDSINQMQKEKILSRDSNTANSSTFIIAQANIEDNRIKKTTELRLDVRYSLIPGIVETWSKTLSWDKSVVTEYAKAMLGYYLCKTNTDEAEYNKKTENTIWPITVLDFERSMLAAMTGAKVTRTMTDKERSDISKALLVASHTWQGAQMGSYWGPYGTVIGAVVGFAIGMAVMLFE